jgi:kynurenine/2-aminoadipate aminotransferase
MDCNLLPIRTDEHGIIPDELKAILSKWNPRSGVDGGRQIPKILYTVPNGGNPTGASLTLERRKEIYKVPDTKVGYACLEFTIELLMSILHGAD